MVATTLAVSGGALIKAGAGVATALSEAGSGKSSMLGSDYAVDFFIVQAESRINSTTRFNWTDEYPNLNADTRFLLREAAENMAAVYCILYDMSGYTSRSEAESMINVLLNQVNDALKLLSDKEVKRFIDDA